MKYLNDVLFREFNKTGVIILNRPEVLNAITLAMATTIGRVLTKWEKQKDLVIIKGAGDKAFSAGGDLRSVYNDFKKKQLLPFDFQQSLFRLSYLTKNYKIPIIPIINGLTMGGGASISIFCKYCVATENTLFAMPEVGLGFLPDVGSTYVFSRLPGKLGVYLALTGQSLTGADMYQLGLVSHFCRSTDLLELEHEMQQPSSILEAVLKKFMVKELPEFSYSDVMSKINYCFAANNVEELFKKLEGESSDWAETILKQLMGKAPTSLKIAFKEINLASNMEFEQCLKMEYRANCLRLKDPDFCEGVRAVIMDKDSSPKWDPPALQEVSDMDIEKYFRYDPEVGNLNLKF